MFRPSIHGWPFGNEFECSGPELGIGGPPPPDLGMGGGLCWSALDRYYRGVTIPRDMEAPSPGDPLHAEVYQRQVASVAGLWPKIREWHNKPDGSWWNRIPLSHPFGSDLTSRSRREWHGIRRHIRAGEPVLLVLLSMTGGYDRPRAVRQVLVTAAFRGGRRAKLWLYDPDAPGDDRVRLSFNLAGPLEARLSDGTDIRGFFAVKYDRTHKTMVRAESFDDRSVLGMNRNVRGRPSMAAGLLGLDLVARDDRGSLLHFHRNGKPHWEGRNVTESQGFGTHELHTDPVAIRQAAALHAFGLNYVGDLVHFRLGRSWSVENLTEQKRIGARFRLVGQVVPVPGPRWSLSIVGRDKDGGLVHYERIPFRGWQAEQVPGDVVSGPPLALRDGDLLHVIGMDIQGRVLHWQRRTEWAMTNPDEGEGPYVRLVGEPQLVAWDDQLLVFGRTGEGELAIMKLGRNGTWTRTIRGRLLSGNPRVTHGPSGLHVFVPTRTGGILHLWGRPGEWQSEDIMETRPALYVSGIISELVCWGSSTELQVFERRGSTLRALAWRPDADWVVDPVTARASNAPSIFLDHDERPHLFFTDRWGTVLHVEKGNWKEPGRPTLDVRTDAPGIEDGPQARPVVETADAPTDETPVEEPGLLHLPVRMATPEEDTHDSEPHADEPAATIEAADRPAGEATSAPVEEPAPDSDTVVVQFPVRRTSPVEEPNRLQEARLEVTPEYPAQTGDESAEEADTAPSVAEEPEVERLPAEPVRAETLPSPETEQEPQRTGTPLMDFDEAQAKAPAVEESVARLQGPETRRQQEPEPLPLIETPDPVEAGAEAEPDPEPVPMEEMEELPFLDFDDDEPASPWAEPLPYLNGGPPEAEADQEEEEEAAQPLNRRVKGGPASPRKAVDVEPMDLSLLDTWPDTGPSRRRRKDTKHTAPHKNGGDPPS